jgi:hypothetical protein
MIEEKGIEMEIKIKIKSEDIKILQCLSKY